MAHTFVLLSEDDTDVQFVCTACGVELGFNKPEIGEPAAVPVGDSWTTPENPDRWTQPCTE